MRNPLRVVLIAALVVFVGISVMLFQKYRESQAAMTSLQTEDEVTRGRYAEAIGSIAAIQDSLNAIVLGNESVKLTPTGYETEHNVGQTTSDQVLDRIGELRAGVERSKARIEELDRNLKKSGMKIEGLEHMLASLRKTVVKKEEMIAELTSQVDSLHTQVDGLTASVEQQRQELGTIYMMMGSKKELTDQGAVVAKGGVLGLGKTLKASGDVNQYMATTIDTDQQLVVSIPAKKAQVLTAQPPSSYLIEPDGDHLVLRILDAKEFRKVRQLVIVTEA
jgi:hypothetical protein